MCPKTNKPKPKITRSMRLGLGAHSRALEVLLRLGFSSTASHGSGWRASRDGGRCGASPRDRPPSRTLMRFAARSGAASPLRRAASCGSAAPRRRFASVQVDLRLPPGGQAGHQLPGLYDVWEAGGGIKPAVGRPGGRPLMPPSPSPRGHHFADMYRGLCGRPRCVY